MATVVNDLVTRFGFSGNIGPLTGFNNTLLKSIGLSGTFVGSLELISIGFSIWAGSVLTGVDALDALSNQTGVAIGKLHELNYMAGQTQSSSAAVESTIRSLTNTIGQAAQRGSEDFARLGISVRYLNGQVKTADVVLEEVRQRFNALNLSLQERKTLASSLGIDESLIQLLGKSNDELSQLRAEARRFGLLTKEQTQQAAEYQKSLNGVKFGWETLKQLIAIGVAPELTRLSDNFSNLLAENKDWIINGVQFAVTWVGNILEAFHRMLPVLLGIAIGFVAVEVATVGWTAALTALHRVPLIAFLTALFLAVDDLIVAFRGGQSVIADFFSDNFDVDIVKGMTIAIEALGDALDAVIEGFRSLNEFGASLGKGAFNFVEGAKETAGSIADFFGFGDNQPPINNSNSVNQSNTILIQTNDPVAAGRAVRSELEGQLDNANTQLNVGGR